MSFVIRFSYSEIALQGIVNLKTCREIESETERLDDMLVIRKKKRTKERAKKCSWRENWYVISDFVSRSVRLIRKKYTCFPIGYVRDRRRERYNRVYVLSRVRNNRVSLYSQNMDTNSLRISLSLSQERERERERERARLKSLLVA